MLQDFKVFSLKVFGSTKNCVRKYADFLMQ